MKKSIIIFGIAAVLTGRVSAGATTPAVSRMESVDESRAYPIPVKRFIKWVSRFYKAYKVYDRLTGYNMSCESAYYNAVRAYQDYERLYSLAYSYWGTNYGVYYYNEAMKAYSVAEHYNYLLHNGCR